MKLNDNSLTPLYQQIIEDIKSGISDGSYPPGSRIPSEAELSQMYSVSRVTVRRAIEELAGEGYLTRRQGKGTFVNQRKMARKIRQSSDVESFTDVCAEAGLKAGAHVLERRVVPARAENRHLFGESCEQLVYVARLRTADGVPIMEEHNYLPYEGFAFLLDEPLEDASLFGLLLERRGVSPQCLGHSTIEIALASSQMAANLAIAPGDPLFFEHVFFHDQQGQPLCLSNKYLVGSRYLFEL